MPTYEYECRACGEAFERFQSITDGPVRRCPKCRRAKVRRLISAGGGLLFRGSGFYTTDYRSAEYQSKAKAESGSATPAAKEAPAAPKEGPAKETKRSHGAKSKK